MNIHLGLSPYYRGAGTNFWPIVNDEFSFIGTTYMHIDEGVDTGEIIHQIRARIYPFDNIHSIGNRLIRDSIKVCSKLIKNYDKVNSVITKKSTYSEERVYKKKDFSEESIKLANHNLYQRIKEYLANKESIDQNFPLIVLDI